MIFTGDISIPFFGGITLDGFPVEEISKQWIGNLEGSLVNVDDERREKLLKRRIVFNDVGAVREFLSQIPFYAFGMANNHLLDACGVEESKANLSALGKSQFGTGVNIVEAMRPLLIEDQGCPYAIYAFGWKNINCRDATDKKEGSNPYNKWHVEREMKNAVEKYPDRRVIAFMHWNTELELYPQPLDREISHRLIDMGVYAVIGCHAHRVQPIEIYKGHPIVYGLGNFAFRQQSYMAGKLKFPEFSYPEIAFEINRDDFFVHSCLYIPETNVVKYQGKHRVTESNAPFGELDASTYKEWFKKNRYQRKGIAINYYEDSKFMSGVKYRYGVLRGNMINLLVKNERVFNLLKGLASEVFK